MRSGKDLIERFEKTAGLRPDHFEIGARRQPRDHPGLSAWRFLLENAGRDALAEMMPERVGRISAYRDRDLDPL